MKVFRMGDVPLPTKSHESDAGYDLYAPYELYVPAHGFVHVDLHIAIALEPHEMMLIQGRSGLAKREGLFTIGNVIDSGYRGIIGCTLCNMSNTEVWLGKHDRVCQGIILAHNGYCREISEVDLIEDLGITDRGNKGFGSSGA